MVSAATFLPVCRLLSYTPPPSQDVARVRFLVHLWWFFDKIRATVSLHSLLLRIWAVYLLFAHLGLLSEYPVLPGLSMGSVEWSR